MLISLDLPEWVIDAIRRGPAPMVDCGPSLEERLGYIAENWAECVIGWEEQDKRKALYRAFGVHHDDDMEL